LIPVDVTWSVVVVTLAAVLVLRLKSETLTSLLLANVIALAIAGLTAIVAKANAAAKQRNVLKLRGSLFMCRLILL
jgi:hypothetical protein